MSNPLLELLNEYDKIPQEIEDKLDVSRTAFYTWIQGTHAPSRGNVKEILNLFDLSIDEKMAWQIKFKKWKGGN